MFQVTALGWVESSLRDMAQAPKQGDEGAPPAWLAMRSEVADGLRDLRVGDEIIILTWLDRADRETLTVRPRGDPHRPLTGVFSTRSPDRPNPIGVHRAAVVAVEANRLQVDHLEALDGTPILDIKPVLDEIGDR